MRYIDLKTGLLVGSNGIATGEKLRLVEAQQQDFEFAFFEMPGVFLEIPSGATMTMVGNTVEKAETAMVYATGAISVDRKSVSFTLDTYTAEYFAQVLVSGTECKIDINILYSGDTYNTRLARLDALADVRVVVDGVPPSPATYYLSKDETLEALGTAPLLEFSVDGATNWHETQTDADRYYRSTPQGIPESWQEPGEAIALVVGTSGSTPTVAIDSLTGHWIINGIDTGILARGNDGIDGINGTPGAAGADGGQPPVERVYYHATYGTVCYLDSTNAMPFLGYQSAGWSKIKFWLVTANAAVTGNIVLNVGAERFVVAVGATLTMAELTFSAPVTGRVTIERDTTDADDTLKDGSSTVVTALVVDWRCY